LVDLSVEFVEGEEHALGEVFAEPGMVQDLVNCEACTHVCMAHLLQQINRVSSKNNVNITIKHLLREFELAERETLVFFHPFSVLRLVFASNHHWVLASQQFKHDEAAGKDIRLLSLDARAEHLLR